METPDWLPWVLFALITFLGYLGIALAAAVLNALPRGPYDAEQETTIQWKQGTDQETVRAESQRQPPRVRRAVAEVPSSLPGQAPTVRGVHSQREDSSRNSDRPHQGS